MVTSLLLLFVVASTIWVYFDAKGRDWSGDNVATSPFTWAAGTLLLWIVIFPVYLAKRGRRAPQRLN
jgi:hypothetical protein